MTLLAPWFLVAAGAVALGVVVLHLLALQRPPEAPLPTARFVPEAPARATSRAMRPTDRLLLLLRVLAVLLVGLGFARPVPEASRRAVRQVIVVDRGRAVASAAELRDSVLAVQGAGDVLLPLDGVAHAPVAAADTVPASLVEAVPAPASLSAGLVAAQRLASALADSTDSVRIVLVTPLARESLDAATAAIRAEWPGAVRVVRVAAREPADSVAPALDVGTLGDDPLAVAARLGGLARAGAPARLRRAAPSGADSAWARETGGVLLVWSDDTAAVPAGWSARTPPDTVGALVADDAVLVAAFVRRAAASDTSARVPLRWSDGAPAALDAPLGRGCVRTVAVALPAAGDLPLRPAFGRLLGALAAPCGGAARTAAMPDSAMAWLRGTGNAAVAVARERARPSPFVPWLLGAGLLLLLAEPLLRRGRTAA